MNVHADFAETLALAALAWLAADPDRFTGFLNATGLAPGEIGARAADPEFLASVLDHLLQFDVWITEFCISADYRPEDPRRARMALPGAAGFEW